MSHLAYTRSDRGFKRFPELPDDRSGVACVVESSAAMGPHVHLFTECPVDLNDPRGPRVVVSLHYRAHNALRLAAQLIEAVEAHYQIAGDDSPIGDLVGQTNATLGEMITALETWWEGSP